MVTNHKGPNVQHQGAHKVREIRLSATNLDIYKEHTREHMTFFFFSSGFHKFRPSLNFLSFSLNLLTAEIIYISHHAQLAHSIFEDYGMGQHVRQGKVSSVLSLRDPKGIERRMRPYQSPAQPFLPCRNESSSSLDTTVRQPFAESLHLTRQWSAASGQ